METIDVNRLKSNVQPLQLASAVNALRHVFVRDLNLMCNIGVFENEKVSPQRVLVNLDLAVREGQVVLEDEYSNVVCYAQIVQKAHDIVENGHINLVETLAEKLADVCLQDARVRSCRVRVEKLDVFEEAQSVGVEIERLSPFQECQ